MENHNRTKFVQLLNAVCTLYKHSLHEMTFEIYWQALVGFEFDAVRQAFQAHIKHPNAGQFMPKPADILRCLNGDSETRALQAWSRLQQAIRDFGGDKTLVFDDAILHRVIDDMGGWIRLAEGTTAEMDFLVHEFKKRYAAYLLHPPESYPSQLTGRSYWQYSPDGYAAQSPLMIGNPQKAKQVYQQGRAPGLRSPATPLLLSSASASDPKPLANKATAAPDTEEEADA